MRVVVTGASGFIGRNVLLRAPRDWHDHRRLSPHRRPRGVRRRHGLSHVSAVRCDLTDAGDVRGAGDASAGARRRVPVSRGQRRSGGVGPSGRAGISIRTPLALVNFLEHCPRRPRRLRLVRRGVRRPDRRRLAGDAGRAAAAVRDLEAGVRALRPRFFAERRHTVGSYVNVRFFGAYGPHEPARKITTRWMRAIDRRPARVHVRGDGENLIDFMYVDDAVDGFLTLMAARGQRRPSISRPARRSASTRSSQTMARALGVEIGAPARRAHRGIHPVPDRRSDDARSVRRSSPSIAVRRWRAAAAAVSLEERHGAGQPA